MIPQHYLNSVVTGDARELADAIPDESIDLIFTDPVYDRLEDYEWLSRLATRILKPDSACLVYCAIGLLPPTHDAMRAGGLSYRWRLVTRTVFSNEFNGRLIVGTQECLWYERGHSKPLQSIFDLNMSTMQSKGNYKVGQSNWGKSESVITRYVETFSPVGGLVLDPFSGSGSIPAVCKMLSRNYIAFEIDPDTAAKARERITNTQPPLFTLAPQQTKLELD